MEKTETVERYAKAFAAWNGYKCKLTETSPGKFAVKAEQGLRYYGVYGWRELATMADELERRVEAGQKVA